MTQRTSFILAAVLTSFILVMVGGVAARVAVPASASAAADTAVAAIAAPTLDPTAQALLAARDAQYQQAIQQANQQLQQAYADQQALADQLAQTQGQPAAQAPAPVQLAAPAAQQYPVSPQMAASVALAAAPGASLARQPELVSFKGTVAYEVDLDQGKVYVDANNGQTLFNGAAASAGSPALNSQAPAGGIIQAQAISAAKAYLGGGNVVGVVMDNTHGATAYKVTFDNGTNVYVNVATGQVAYVEMARGGGEGRESNGGENEAGDH